jgi:sialate O-acetylesterase
VGAATPENILDFSAVAYFFAAELYRKNGVPVGLINSAVGGSPAQAWLSKNTLKKYPEYLQAAEQCANPAYVDSIKAVDNERSKNWHAELNRKDPGTGRWSKPSTDISDWPEISLPGYWNEKNVTLKNGSVWFCKYFGLTEELAGEDATLGWAALSMPTRYLSTAILSEIPPINTPPHLPVPGSILKAGQNRITVRVISQSGKGGFVPEKTLRTAVCT